MNRPLSRLAFFACVMSMLVACAGPGGSVVSTCSTSPEAPCSYAIRRPVGDRHLSPHLSIYFDDIIEYYVVLPKTTQVKPLQTTRVPYGDISLHIASSKKRVSTNLKGGYVDINSIAGVMMVYLVTDQGPFVGNGRFSLNGDSLGQAAP